MNLWFRLIYELLTWRLRSKENFLAIGRRTFRVWPTDLDIYRHMNNGVFLTLMDIGRYDISVRSGAWQRWKKIGWYPVVVAETITFRKSLKLWQAFDIESKVVGWDEQAFYFEQRFVVANEVYAKAIVRVRFLKRSMGSVTPEMILADGGGWHGEIPKLDPWIVEWAKKTALPKGSEPADSNW
jgi:acyl-CoA thioesterase FadM